VSDDCFFVEEFIGRFDAFAVYATCDFDAAWLSNSLVASINPKSSRDLNSLKTNRPVTISSYQPTTTSSRPR